MPDQKFAIIGDIHSNWEAFKAVLEDAEERGVTAYACLGDIVGYNASPIECIEKIQELGCVCVRGNHDHYCSHDEELEHFHPLAARVVRWTRDQLSDAQRSWLRGLQYKRSICNFTLVHSTLDMPEKWAYIFDDLDALTSFNYQITPVCFHGHTHVPIVFEYADSVAVRQLTKLKIERGRKYFVNVGSIGQPRDGDSRAAYVVYDVERKEVELRRVEYDISKAQARIRDVGLPHWLGERLGLGK